MLQTTDVDGVAPKFQITNHTGLAIDDANFDIKGNEIHVKCNAGLDGESANNLVDIFALS